MVPPARSEPRAGGRYPLHPQPTLPPPGIRPGWKGVPPPPILGSDLDGGYPPPPARSDPRTGGCYPLLEQHSVYLLHGGWYASCVHAGGLSCS